MSEEKELKLACLHQAGGDLDHAQRLFDWVSGSVRATPDSEAAEVSAPKQDKPQQSFNYRHPSKYGTDVPRRCYLEELTPEERAIRDLVDTVERLGAHPLLTATVIQLMKAGEDLADWVDIGLRDKAIAALSPGNDLGLLDDGQQETSPVQSAIDQDKALQSKLDQFLQQPFALLWGGGVVAPPGLDPHHLVEVVTRGNVLRTRAVKDFQWLSGHAPTNPEDDIIAYRPLATWDEVIQHHVHAHKYEPKPGDLDRAAAHLDDDPLAATMLQEAMDSGHADGPRITGAERSEDEIVEHFVSMPDDQFNAMKAHIERTESEDELLENQPGVSDESSSQASSTDAPAWQRFRASEGWHTFAGVRDYEYFTFLEGVKFEMAIVGGGRVIVTSPGPGVKLDEPVRNVEAYRIIDAKADEVGETTSELDSSSEPQAATEQEQKDESTPVLDALPPSIPRSEIPEGAAVETFTDTGVETVKIGGITHIVEHAPEPIQNGDASVFAHGIIREADEPEARRFSLGSIFGGKAKVDA